jgi:outer membrane receptor protein involved in Fe transport
MTRKHLLTFMLLLTSCWVMAQTTLSGKVLDLELKDAVIGASIKISKDGTTVKGGSTNLDGEFRFTLDPGRYDLEVSYTGSQAQKITGIQVLDKQANVLPDIMLTSGTTLINVEIIAYKVPLIEKGRTEGGQTLTSDQLKTLPTRNVNQIVATTAGTSSIDGGAISIKGSRSNGTNFYVDGIRVFGASTVPVQDIEQISVVTSGLGAEYGDVTGGVISVVTKGPAKEYHGGMEAESSEYLDAFGYNLLSANFSGPILRNRKTKESIIGFRLSGQYRSQKDDDPTALPIHVAKPEVLARLRAQPLTRYFGSTLNSAEFLTNDSLNVLKYRPNEKQTDVNITGKLDFKLNSNMDISVTGFFQDVKDRFTPSGTGITASGNAFGSTTATTWSTNNWTMLNSDNNPTQLNQRYRANVRFRHRLGRDASEETSGDEFSGISNASYTLQGAFEREAGQRGDMRHGENFFNYGYIGKFNFDYEPTIIPRQGVFTHVANGEVFRSYEGGSVNPGLAAYNSFANPEAPASYLMRNGLFANDNLNIWGGSTGHHANVSNVYNNYRLSETDIITGSGTIDFDLKLGKKAGIHGMQVGLLFEQRTIRNYSLDPVQLWNLANQKVNGHFNGLDTTRIIDTTFLPNGAAVPIYANQISAQTDNKFFRELRKSLGLNIEDYVNANALNPNQLNLGMFGARELTDAQLVSYNGYDFKGNKTATNIGFDDFFKSVDETGVRNFPVAPFRPSYFAGYIKDKFQYKDLYLNVGLRVERFDLNTKVLRDPLSLYEIIGAKEFVDKVDNGLVLPANIGSDFKVYTDGPNSKKILGYRNGEQWYDKNGIQRDGAQVVGGSTINPWIKDTIIGDNILDTRYDPNTSFADYEPQINIMPRIAFSFPISDDALFFAHYDVLVQRPPSGWEATPLDYLYFENAARTPLENPNLKPERVVDYEVGFQQKLTDRSSLKLSAYYREMRDMIQRRTILYVPSIGQYDNYSNVDFGTTKGFTMQYDVRRTGNAEFRLAYTLQFADGTGSDADSQRGLTARGNIRNISPLTFDERHNFNAILDYRYGSGKQYNGPTISGFDVFANTGINFQFVTVSGRPYSAALAPQRFGADGFLGSINGSRMPWRTNLDLRLDKTIDLSGVSKKDLNMNVYLRVANVLNMKNVVGVYRFTGSPSDDGFLASQQGASIVRGIGEVYGTTDPVITSYTYAMMNPNNFTQPRRIVLGLNFGF